MHVKEDCMSWLLYGHWENRQHYYHMHSCKMATRNRFCTRQTTVTGFLLAKGTTSVLLGAANSNGVRWVTILACRQTEACRQKEETQSILRNQGGRLQQAAPDQLVNELRIGPCRRKSTVGRSIQQRRVRQPWSCSARGHRSPSVETGQQASATAPVKLTIHGARTLGLVCTPQSAERSPVALRWKTLNVGLTLRQTKLPRDKASHTIRTSVRTWPKHW